MQSSFADIILPLALKTRLTYSIPVEMQGIIMRGVRVLVQLRDKKVYTGVVAKVHNDTPDFADIKPVLKVFGPDPVINNRQLELWKWISGYGICCRAKL